MRQQNKRKEYQLCNINIKKKKLSKLYNRTYITVGTRRGHSPEVWQKETKTDFSASKLFLLVVNRN